jgi:uncharacterized RmlC-like cupin family protein
MNINPQTSPPSSQNKDTGTSSQKPIFTADAYILMGKGTKSSSKGALSFNGSNLMLTLDSGHVIFDEPLSNINEIETYNSHVIVHMPTGDAYVYFADPKSVTEDLAISAATGVGGGVAANVVGLHYADKAVNKLHSEKETIARLIDILTGKVKIKNSANTDIGNTKKGVFMSIGILMMLCGGFAVFSSFAAYSQYKKTAFIIQGVSIIVAILGYFLYKFSSGSAREKTSFPSSR